MSEFTKVDLTKLADEGVLMAANERFFWPLGLALTWTQAQDGRARRLHVRQWTYDDGHHEGIELSEDDEVGKEKRRRFANWLIKRVASMPPEERDRAACVGHRPDPSDIRVLETVGATGWRALNDCSGNWADASTPEEARAALLALDLRKGEFDG